MNTTVATVTVKFDANADGDFVDATDLTVVRQYLIGVTGSISNGAVRGASATVKNVQGATVKLVRGSKSKTVVASKNSRTLNLKYGKGKTTVYVNGVKVARK